MSDLAGSEGEKEPLAPLTVGAQLRQAREAAGQDVAAVAALLRLGERQVVALENGEWDALPGATFVRGFVRNYARHFGVDPAPLMSQLDSLAKPANVLDIKADAPAPVSFGGSTWRRDRHVLVGGVLAVLLAALVYFLLPENLEGWRADIQELINSLGREEEPAPAPAAPASAPEPVFPPGTTPQQIMNPQALMPEPPAPAAAAPAENAAAPAVPAPVVAPPAADKAPAPQGAAGQGSLLVLVDKMSWLEIRDREKRVVFSQRLAAGSQQSIPGDGPLSITVGYAPGVRLSWRGQPVDLEPFTRGDVARLVLE